MKKRSQALAEKPIYDEPATASNTSDHVLTGITKQDNTFAWACSCGGHGIPVRNIVDGDGKIVLSGEEWARGAYQFHIELSNVG